jgi:hypothetical protein
MPLYFNALEQNVIFDRDRENVFHFHQYLCSHPIEAEYQFENSRVGASVNQKVKKWITNNSQEGVLVMRLTGEPKVENNSVKNCGIKITEDHLELKIFQGVQQVRSSGALCGLLAEATN